GPLARNFNLAMFSRTMATLLKSGITIGDAFEIASNTLRNARYKIALRRVQQGTETGIPASAILEEFPKLFPSITTSMLAVGDRRGVHFSDADGCALPAKKYHVFRGNSFTSATTTIDTIDLPANVTITGLSLGGGCDVTFSRFHGIAAAVGSITLTNVNSATR